MCVVTENVPLSSTSPVVCHKDRIRFIIYTADLASVVEGHGLSLHQYTDDSQIYGSCWAAATSALSSDIIKCTDDIAGWM